MTNSSVPQHCPLCSGNMVDGTTTVTTDLDFGVVVIRKVPATVCDQCGEDWIASGEVKRIEQIVQKARLHPQEVEVISLAS